MIRVKYSSGAVRAVKVRLGVVNWTVVSPPEETGSTRNVTAADTGIPEGAGISKFKVSF